MISCPSCLKLNTQGRRFCWHCGCPLDRRSMPEIRDTMSRVAASLQREREIPSTAGLSSSPRSFSQAVTTRGSP